MFSRGRGGSAAPCGSAPRNWSIGSSPATDSRGAEAIVDLILFTCVDPHVQHVVESQVPNCIVTQSQVANLHLGHLAGTQAAHYPASEHATEDILSLVSVSPASSKSTSTWPAPTGKISRDGCPCTD